MSQNKNQICSVTVMDSTDVDISFDENGVSNYVHYYNSWFKKHSNLEINKDKLEKLINRIKKDGHGKKYDLIMGLSGGVDSSYLAHLVVKEWKLRPLIVHVDSGWNSELAVKNIESMMNKLDIDLHTLVIDWPTMKSLQRSFFKSSVPNCDIPQDHSFIAGLLRETKKYGIKHLINGGNMATESILPISWGHEASDLVHLKDINNSFEKISLKKFPKVTFFDKYIYFPYLLNLKTHRPLDLINYNKDEAKKLLIEEYGWRDYGGKHYESLFTKIFQSYYLYKKFGFDKRKAHFSSLIVSGQMTREQALKELKSLPYNEDEIKRDLKYFIKKLGFSQEEWDKIMLDKPNKHTIFKIDKKPDIVKGILQKLRKFLRK